MWGSTVRAPLAQSGDLSLPRPQHRRARMARARTGVGSAALVWLRSLGLRTRARSPSWLARARWSVGHGASNRGGRACRGARTGKMPNSYSQTLCGGLRIPSEGRQLGISGVDLGGIRGRARSTPPVDPLRSGRTSRAYRDAAGPPWSMSGLRPTAPRRATVGRHRGRLRVHDPTTRSRPEGRGAGHPSGCSPRAIATVAWSAARSATITSA